LQGWLLSGGFGGLPVDPRILRVKRVQKIHLGIHKTIREISGKTPENE